MLLINLCFYSSFHVFLAVSDHVVTVALDLFFVSLLLCCLLLLVARVACSCELALALVAVMFVLVVPLFLLLLLWLSALAHSVLFSVLVCLLRLLLRSVWLCAYCCAKKTAKGDPWDWQGHGAQTSLTFVLKVSRPALYALSEGLQSKTSIKNIQISPF